MENKQISLTNSIVAKDVITNEEITLTKVRLSFVRIFPLKSQIIIGYDFVSDNNKIGKHKELSVVSDDYANLDPSEDNILNYIKTIDIEARGTIE